MMDRAERDCLLKEYPVADILIKKYVGAAEFIKGEDRFCLWITENNKELAFSIPPIEKRLTKVQSERAKSKKVPTQKAALTPHLFTEIRYNPEPSLFVPLTSSERRKYIPIGLLPAETVISNAGFGVYNADIYIFGIITSKIHNIWNNAISGKMKSDYRYSNSLGYNTFPFPKISEEQKKAIEVAAEEVLLVRAEYPEKTLAELYDPDKMPANLRAAHHELDMIVEGCYRKEAFANDEERLEHLFKLYEKMTKKK